MSFAFDSPVAIVDSNVERILLRLFRDSLPGRPPVRLMQELADVLLPHDTHREFNLFLLDLGALVCRYDRPRCEECPLTRHCDVGQEATGILRNGGPRPRDPWTERRQRP